MRRSRVQMIALAMAVVVVLMCGCSASQTASPPAAPDYTDADNWMFAPTSVDHPVDVFYLYPTVSQASPGGSIYSSVEDPEVRKAAAYIYQVQGTAFADDANMFVPYYRQLVDLSSLGTSTTQLDDLETAVPEADVTAAFDYYVTHLNGGRPFIIAGHSQGAAMTKSLLTGYLKDHPDVYARMIAAYAIGDSITEELLASNPQLTFAEGPDDTGVVASWNTESPGVTVANPLVRPGAIAINPITWTRGEELAPASESLGSWMPDASGTFGKVMDYASAQVDLQRGVVVAAEPAVAPDTGSSPWPKGVLHSFDIPFYYFNLRQNAKDRTDAFLRTWTQAPT